MYAEYLLLLQGEEAAGRLAGFALYAMHQEGTYIVKETKQMNAR